MTERETLLKQYRNGRSNLLLALVLTLVNIVMLFAGGDTMMLFSISFPYYLVIFGGLLELDFLLILAAFSILGYFLFWLLSKKNPGFLIAALVCMILDTLLLALLYLLAEDVSGILDVLFHIWIVYYLFQAVRANSKLKKLPSEPDAEPLESVNCPPLRRVEEGEKHRVLLEAIHGTYRVCYRRVKKTNQLVINDYIYDELEMVMEPAHSLKAVVDGHQFEVGFNGVSKSYFNFDGVTIATKIRLF